MKKTIILLVALAVSLVWILPALSQDDVMVLGGPDQGFATPQRAAVAFSHAAHQEYAGVDNCLPCHHTGKENGAFVESDDYSAKCSDCHDAAGKPGLNDLASKFHQQCMGCHTAQGKGPTACGECHVNPPAEPAQ
ncbi:MAG: acidic tetraheme cytochrome c3 TmcA [Desulfovibrionaceae bacterium]